MAQGKETSQEMETLQERIRLLEDFQRATLNLLEDVAEEKARLTETQQATMNMLEDMDEERQRSEDRWRAVINMAEDFEIERVKAERTKNQLEEVNKELEAFSYSVSHDLRAPLRAISGFSDAVLEDYADKLDDEGKRYLMFIEENAHKMGQLIDDLLSFSRLGRQGIKLTELDIKSLAKEVFNDLTSQEPDRDIEFIVDDVPPAKCDQSLMTQVLTNLISNAIKFTRPRKKAVIELGYESQRNGGAYYIKDNGVGFDMKYVDKLFGVFQRLHSDKEFEGTGAGLAIVKRIIIRHGGRVWAEAKVNQGATFYFTLPETRHGYKNRENSST